MVRYGIRRPDDSLIVDSLRVVDAVLKVEPPFGPCWHRNNNDGVWTERERRSFCWLREGAGLATPSR